MAIANEKRLPTLQEIRKHHRLTSRDVADAARVPLRIEYLMEIGGGVSKEEALRVLHALSHLTKQRYTLENVGGVHIRG